MLKSTYITTTVRVSQPELRRILGMPVSAYLTKVELLANGTGDLEVKFERRSSKWMRAR